MNTGFLLRRVVFQGGQALGGSAQGWRHGPRRRNHLPPRTPQLEAGYFRGGGRLHPAAIIRLRAPRTHHHAGARGGAGPPWRGLICARSPSPPPLCWRSASSAPATSPQGGPTHLHHGEKAWLSYQDGSPPDERQQHYRAGASSRPTGFVSWRDASWTLTHRARRPRAQAVVVQPPRGRASGEAGGQPDRAGPRAGLAGGAERRAVPSAGGQPGQQVGAAPPSPTLPLRAAGLCRWS